MSAPSDDGIGFKRPPVKSQFKKGQSGNPRGRARFPKRAQDLVDAVLARKVRIVDGGVQRSVSVREAILTKLALTALGGNKRALKVLMEFHAKHGGGPGSHIEYLRFDQTVDDE